VSIRAVQTLEESGAEERELYQAWIKKALEIEFNKKNRVTVAQFASSEAIANTPHSPRFNNTIPQESSSVKENIPDTQNQVRRRRNKNYLDVESRFGVAESH
jgi:hypothetical protein